MKYFFFLALTIFIHFSTLNAVNYRNIRTRILGGKPAKLKQLPYQVGLSIKNELGKVRSRWCGGTLISSEWVLTAAHCIFDWNNGWSYDVEILIGSIIGLDLDNTNEPGRKIIYSHSQNFYIREDFESPYLRNDIALIKIPEPVELNDYVQIANLPRRNTTKESLIGHKVITSGWGQHDLPSEYEADKILKYTKLEVKDFKECSSYYSFVDDDPHICLNAPGKSACPGDSGGPNVIKEEDGTFTVIGISSFIIKKGCNIGYPTVVTRVSNYLDWISEITGIIIRD